uniref:amidohydrolase n=1 Tax=Nocardiopsis sediminis TaxID=1778267 RepID=UPI0036731955
MEPQRVAQHGGAIMRLVDEIFPLVEGFYVDLHKNPELSHREHRTASAVAEWLTRAGFEVETGIGGTGVVGVLRNGEGPTVLLRGDMDALPIEERTGLPYASTARGTDDDGNDVPIMHACGHDAHTACLVGAADLLADERERWRGTLVVVAQPAEETMDGAGSMLRDGLYTRFPRPDIALAQHVGPQPAGMISHRPGVILGAAATYRVRVHGTGGHASRPHLTVDPVVIAANIVTRLQTVVSREVSPAEMAVVTVGVIRAGSKGNIIPDDAYLEINTRALNEAVADRLRTAIERIVLAEAAASGAERNPEIEVFQQAGVTHNEPEATRQVAAAHRAYFGDGYVIELPEPLTASEDFSEYGLPGDPSPVPYVFWFVGSTPHEVWEAAPGATPYEKLASIPAGHSPFFAPDREPTLRAGLAALTVGALTYLGRPEDIAPTGGQRSFGEAPAGPPVAAPSAPPPPPPPPPPPGPNEPYNHPRPGAAGAVPAAAHADPQGAAYGEQAGRGDDAPAPVGRHSGAGAPDDGAAARGGEGESTAYTDMADFLDDDDDAPPPPPAPAAPAPPQGPPVSAPPPSGPPVVPSGPQVPLSAPPPSGPPIAPSGPQASLSAPPPSGPPVVPSGPQIPLSAPPPSGPPIAPSGPQVPPLRDAAAPPSHGMPGSPQGLPVSPPQGRPVSPLSGPQAPPPVGPPVPPLPSPPQGAPIAAPPPSGPPQGPPVAAPPPQGSPAVSAPPPPPPGATPYGIGEPPAEPRYDEHDPAARPPEDPPYRY